MITLPSLCHICARAWAVLTTPSATRVFRARHSDQRTEIMQRSWSKWGRLDVLPDILIAHGGARLSPVSRIEVRAGGELPLDACPGAHRLQERHSPMTDSGFHRSDCAEANSPYRNGPAWTQETKVFDQCAGALPRAPTMLPAWSFAVGERSGTQREIEALTDRRRQFAGASRPADDVYAIKMVAADSMSFVRRSSRCARWFIRAGKARSPTCGNCSAGVPAGGRKVGDEDIAATKSALRSIRKIQRRLCQPPGVRWAFDTSTLQHRRSVRLAHRSFPRSFSRSHPQPPR